MTNLSETYLTYAWICNTIHRYLKYISLGTLFAFYGTNYEIVLQRTSIYKFADKTKIQINVKCNFNHKNRIRVKMRIIIVIIRGIILINEQ